MKTLWYFGLEPIKSRYTKQLSEEWMPDAFRKVSDMLNQPLEFHPMPCGETPEDISVGQVLDATSRSQVCFNQVSYFLEKLRSGEVKEGDIIFLQDFWTPGIEAAFYAMHQFGICLPVYAMVHAQSVDEYDFTHKMRPWIVDYEKGLLTWMNHKGGALFCASTCHVEHMRKGWGSDLPLVHVVSLPLGYPSLPHHYLLPYEKRPKQAVYSSRLDPEKNPVKFLELARGLLSLGWKVVYTTSASQVRCSDEIKEGLQFLGEDYENFEIRVNQSKQDYYNTLKQSRIQFNTAAQDYVSWTLLEAAAMGCEIVYPAFRSFLECVPRDRLYTDYDDFIKVVGRIEEEPRQHFNLPLTANAGRLLTAYLTLTQSGRPVNIWTNQLADILGITAMENNDDTIC